MSEENELKEFEVFWNMIAKPGEENVVKFPDFYYLRITNVCIPELPEDNSSVRLVANVGTIYLDPKTKEETIKKSSTLVSTLIPGEVEHQQINILFTSLSKVTFEVKGSVPVHISGFIQPVPVDEEEEEGEEDNNEEEEKKE